MTINISEDAYRVLQQGVESGRYSTVDAALDHSVRLFAEQEQEFSDDDLAYIHERIEAGLADVEAGRVVPSEQVLNELRVRLSQ